AATAIGPPRFTDSTAVSGEVLLGFRPECLSLVATPVQEKLNVFLAKLQSTVFLGDQSILTVAVADRIVCGKCRAVVLTPGAALRVHIDPTNVMVFSDGKRLGRSADPVAGARAAI